VARRSNLIAAGFVVRPGVPVGLFDGGLGRSRGGDWGGFYCGAEPVRAGSRSGDRNRDGTSPSGARLTTGFARQESGAVFRGEVADRGVEYGSCGF